MELVIRGKYNSMYNILSTFKDSFLSGACYTVSDGITLVGIKDVCSDDTSIYIRWVLEVVDDITYDIRVIEIPSNLRLLSNSDGEMSFTLYNTTCVPFLVNFLLEKILQSDF